MTLTFHGVPLSNVFRLNGNDENSGTFALGWLLEQSPTYRELVIEKMFGKKLNIDNVVITLQGHGEDGGYTDLEIQSGQQFHAILEAKRWWDVPSVDQLKRYKPRLVSTDANLKRFISVSAADPVHALRQLPADIDGISIVHLSWNDLRHLAKQAMSSASGFEEKLWLRQWFQHLQGFVSMERQIDNKVFVVSLGSQPMVDGKAHTWIDVVEKDKCYFHPIGNNWPIQPPNYIGFRYHGRLQSVHHIESFEIVQNLAEYNRLWLKTDHDHFVYRLGAPMRPPCEIRTGNIYRNGRVQCAIDTLLSGAFDTISAARDETQRRLADHD